ncbi:hypothetical protein [Brevundimonas sp.]|uniref:hypothetical protein n=1 Tax=Brevundimonas sp. TaxID=1871086 RepID=UPI002FC7CAC6
MDASEPRLVFQGAAWKWGLTTLLYISLVVGFSWAIASGIHHWRTTYILPSASPEFKLAIYVCGIIIFVANGCYAFINLCFPPEITLTREGFSVSGTKKVPLTRWADVQEFGVGRRRGKQEWIYCILRSNAGSNLKKPFRQNWIGSGRYTSVIKAEESAGYIAKTLTDWHLQYGKN